MAVVQDGDTIAIDVKSSEVRVRGAGRGPSGVDCGRQA
jgi:hypothetical protein